MTPIAEILLPEPDTAGLAESITGAAGANRGKRVGGQGQTWSVERKLVGCHTVTPTRCEVPTQLMLHGRRMAEGTNVMLERSELIKTGVPRPVIQRLARSVQANAWW